MRAETTDDNTGAITLVVCDGIPREWFTVCVELSSVAVMVRVYEKLYKPVLPVVGTVYAPLGIE
jgi:hypothetical protein